MEKIIIANWKANKTLTDAIFWVERVGSELAKLGKKAILCPPAVFLIPIEAKIKQLNLENFLFLGSQNISHFPQGAYTGEVSASQFSGIVKFSLVGHSERRRYFLENKEQIFAKLNLAKETGIVPIFCFDVPQIDEVFELEDENLICVYEPVSAIGTGVPDTPENAKNIANQVKSKKTNAEVLYGGSVTGENAGDFLKVSDGVLVGTASLDPSEFLAILAKS